MSPLPTPADDLRVAHALADAAAAHSLRLFRTPLDVIAKADESPVTQADRAAESAMREILGAERAGDGIYGEEHGQERLDADRVWVLDPIDGTRSFITGSPLWGTLIGLVQGGRVVLGMVDMPVLGERWVGQAGLGAERNGTPVRASGCTAIAEARIVTTSPDIFGAADWQAFDASEPPAARCAASAATATATRSWPAAPSTWWSRPACSPTTTSARPA